MQPEPRKTLCLKAPPTVVQQYPVAVDPIVVANKQKPIPKKVHTNKPAKLAFLFENYPNVFDKEHRRPLKIGIFNDIIADIAAKGLTTPTPTKVRAMLYFYTMNKRYHASFFDHAFRMGLDGKLTDQAITLDNKQHAFDKLKAYLKFRGKWVNPLGEHSENV